MARKKLPKKQEARRKARINARWKKRQIAIAAGTWTSGAARKRQRDHEKRMTIQASMSITDVAPWE